MGVADIIIRKPYLAWYVKDVNSLSDVSVLEHVLNYGNWQDVQDFLKIKGKNESSKLFLESIHHKRTSYSPAIKAYFIRYFNHINAKSDT